MDSTIVLFKLNLQVENTPRADQEPCGSAEGTLRLVPSRVWKTFFLEVRIFVSETGNRMQMMQKRSTISSVRVSRDVQSRFFTQLLSDLHATLTRLPTHCQSSLCAEHRLCSHLFSVLHPSISIVPRHLFKSKQRHQMMGRRNWIPSRSK